MTATLTSRQADLSILPKRGFARSISSGAASVVVPSMWKHCCKNIFLAVTQKLLPALRRAWETFYAVSLPLRGKSLQNI